MSSANENKDAISVCAAKLLELVNENDPNLKYLGLVGFINLSKIEKKVVIQSKDLIVTCLNDEDFSIRVKALYLLAEVAVPETLKQIVEIFLSNLNRHNVASASSSLAYREELIKAILHACLGRGEERKKEDGDEFEHSRVRNYDWFFAVLLVSGYEKEDSAD